MKFEELGLEAPLLKSLQTEGYTEPTPIQQQAIAHVLAGRDVVGVAQTGTGKTAAFALPILQRVAASGTPRKGRKSRVLVLSPTRELVTQIVECFSVYGAHTPVRQTAIYGGVGQGPQERAIRGGVDILVATPGRLIDLLNQGIVTLEAIETLVVDEADRMLDMGFIHDLRRIVKKLPRKRQTLLFSATMPAEIRHLAEEVLMNPVRIQVASKSPAADNVAQSVYFVNKEHKVELLKHVLKNMAVARAIVFTRTKRGADKVARLLSRWGIQAESIHGDKSQTARQRAIANFKSHRPPVLVATDLAARGLDIDDISHVINYDLPEVPETYVHRIGRTGRAGAAGIAVSFCNADEREHLRAIEALLRKKTPVRTDHPEYPAATELSGDKRRVRSHTSPGPSAGAASRTRTTATHETPPQKPPGKKRRIERAGYTRMW